MQLASNFQIMKTVLLALGLLVVSCTPVRQQKVHNEVWLPWVQSDGQYRIQKVPVSTVSEWSPLRGSAAQLRSHVHRVSETTISSQEVTLEYTHDKSGAIIPTTRFSTEMAAIYVNLEQMQKWDKELEIPEADTARRVYVKFEEVGSDGKKMVNNAFYDASVDSFFVVPYVSSGLPLSVNGGVLAHEHFHSIFARLLLVPLLKASEDKETKEGKAGKGKQIFDLKGSTPHSHDVPALVIGAFGAPGFLNSLNNSRLKLEDSDSPSTFDPTSRNQFVNKIVLRGLNEGLADFWGWIYSNDPCFMQPSFERAISAERCLNAEASSAPSTPIGAQGLTSAQITGRTLPAMTSKESSMKKLIAPNLPAPSLARFGSLIDDKIDSRSELRLMTVDDLSKKFSPRWDEKDRGRQSSRLGYELGSNLARLIYLRLQERGEIRDLVAQRQWAKRIVEVLPSYMSHMRKVYVDDDARLSVVQWEKLVDTLLFGPGSSAIPEGRCEQWQSIMKSKVTLENLTSKCKK